MELPDDHVTGSSIQEEPVDTPRRRRGVQRSIRLWAFVPSQRPNRSAGTHGVLIIRTLDQRSKLIGEMAVELELGIVGLEDRKCLSVGQDVIEPSWPTWGKSVAAASVDQNGGGSSAMADLPAGNQRRGAT